MRRLFWAVLLVPAAAISCAVAYAQTTPSEQPQSESPPSPEEQEIEVVARRLCKAEPVIGTRIARPRKCNTAKELAAYRAQARELIENLRLQPCRVGTTVGDGVQTMGC